MCKAISSYFDIIRLSEVFPRSNYLSAFRKNSLKQIVDFRVKTHKNIRKKTLQMKKIITTDLDINFENLKNISKPHKS